MIELRHLSSLFFFISLLGISWAQAQGGPPMLTDDPETPGSGKWEINIADVSQYSSSQWVSQVPYTDINYGVGDQVQLKYESPMNSVSSQSMPVGGSQAIAGVKYRFINEKENGFDLATYPQYQFSPSYIGNSLSLGTSSVFLPLELTKKYGPFIFNPELAYTIQYGGGYNFVTIGLLLARELSEKYELMAEVFGQYGSASGQQETLFNVGGRWNINVTLTLQASIGTSLNMPAGISSMQFSYIGVQLHL